MPFLRRESFASGRHAVRNDELPEMRDTDGTGIGRILEQSVIENHRAYQKRIDFYRSFGYDLEKERDFILDKSLPLFGDILEIGTGKGHFALALAMRGLHFTSIDVSAEAQQTALLNLQFSGLEKQVVFSIENAEHTSFPDRSFDCIFCVNVFHLLGDPAVALEEIVRLLRPAGKAVISDLTDKGVAIINACHTREGKNHDHLKHCLDAANDYFAAQAFSVKEFSSEAQRTIIASR